MLPGSMRPGDRNLSMRRGLTAIGVETAIMSDATTTTALAAIGIPASFVIIATVSIVGLGWGRATRPVSVQGAMNGDSDVRVSVGGLAADNPDEEVPAIGEEDATDIPSAGDLFDPGTTVRVIAMQNLVPLVGTVSAYLAFRFLPIWGF